MRTRAVVALWTLALAAASGAISLVLTSDHEPHKLATIAIAAPAGLAFVAAGLVARVQRPGNRTGTLLLLVGFSWFLGSLAESNHSLIFTLGLATNFVFLGFVVHLLLAFPSGRLEGRAERNVAASMYALVALYAASVPFSQLDNACDTGSCPENAVLIWSSDSVTHVIELAVPAAALGLIAIAIGLLIRRWRRATPPLRRALAPVLATGGGLIFLLAALAFADLFLGSARVPNSLVDVALLAIPLSFLFGLLRTRLARAAAGKIAVEIGDEPAMNELEDAVRRALRDPSARLVLWRGEHDGYVDLEGGSVDLPAVGDQQAVTAIEHLGRPVAALIHDSALLEDPPVLSAVSSAAGLTLENVRLQDELHERLEELHASRARIVEAGDDERRRLERNLHDGAQQRLVALSLALRLAQAKLGDDPGAASELLSAASGELTLALEELRELARGIHPAVLTDRGLGPALESLADRTTIAVELEALPEGRFPTRVEAAAFYVVSESLANVAKYAEASSARVRVTNGSGQAIVEVSDDGIGGADAARGSGLRGLVDRVEALDGRLEIESKPGRGTRIKAVIPCE